MPKKILIADDNEDSRLLLVWMLQKLGYETLEAASGAEAVEKAISRKPDLILMDLGLPDMTGIDAARAIKQNPGTAHIPIIAHTAWDRTEWREAARQVEIADYLVKPVPTNLMKGTVEKFINGSIGSTGPFR
jgi:CheY-like chemotaxis protein